MLLGAFSEGRGGHPYSAGSAGLSASAAAFREQQQMGRPGGSRGRKDQRLGMKKITVRKRVTGVKELAWGAEQGGFRQVVGIGGLAREPLSGGAREANLEPFS